MGILDFWKQLLASGPETNQKEETNMSDEKK